MAELSIVSENPNELVVKASARGTIAMAFIPLVMGVFMIGALVSGWKEIRPDNLPIVLILGFGGAVLLGVSLKMFLQKDVWYRFDRRTGKLSYGPAGRETEIPLQQVSKATVPSVGVEKEYGVSLVIAGNPSGSIDMSLVRSTGSHAACLAISDRINAWLAQTA